jgi:hypothetical protein
VSTCSSKSFSHLNQNLEVGNQTSICINIGYIHSFGHQNFIFTNQHNGTTKYHKSHRKWRGTAYTGGSRKGHGWRERESHTFNSCSLSITHRRGCQAASCGRPQSDLEASDSHTGEQTGGTMNWDSASCDDGVAGSVELRVRCSLGLGE